MKVRVPDGALAEGLTPLGDADGEISNGLLFAPARVKSWDEAEAELMDLFVLSKEAVVAHAPVVYLVETSAVLGRSAVLDSALANGLVGAARNIAFEGRRKDQYATVISVSAGQSAASVIEAVQFAVSTAAGSGQVVTLGAEHIGAMLP